MNLFDLNEDYEKDTTYNNCSFICFLMQKG